MLLKKKTCLSILLTTYKFLLILIERMMMKKILMKKIKYRIVDYHCHFKRFMKKSYSLHNLCTEVNFLKQIRKLIKYFLYIYIFSTYKMTRVSNTRSKKQNKKKKKLVKIARRTGNSLSITQNKVLQ